MTTKLKFEATVSEEQIQAMVLDEVSRCIRGSRVSADENGDEVRWEESAIRPVIEKEVRRQVGEAVTKLAEENIRTAIEDGFKRGFEQGEYANPEVLTLQQMIENYMTKKRRVGDYNSRVEKTEAEILVESCVEQCLRAELAVTLRELNEKFKAALTQKFTDAAAEALRRAVGA